MNYELFSIILTAVVALALIVFALVKIVKNKWISELTDTLKEAIKKAEASDKKGSEKKQMVMEEVGRKCQELGIPLSLIMTTISKLINQIITYYNYINK